MKFLTLITLSTFLITTHARYTIVIHGGAGTITKNNISVEREKEIKAALKAAILLGEEILKRGGHAVQVVEKVVVFMENSPLFNAAKGAVFNHEGQQEMDACIMDGRDLSSGAVSGVAHLKNPIIGARLVKDSTRHVFLSGKKAENFCLQKGAQYADSSYFFVQRRWDDLQKALKKERQKNGTHDGGAIYREEGRLKYGTVGCVVVDSYGDLAAATSTGGLTNKQHGRIGDSPIVGAGTYASNSACAVSCTGIGEFFIRGTIARDISARMEFRGASLDSSGRAALEKLTEMNGYGGFIGVDKMGNVIMLFNTEGMYRAYKKSEMPHVITQIYKD